MKMVVKALFLTSLLIVVVLCFARFKVKKEIIDFNVIKIEINEFVKKAKEESANDSTHNVYAIKFTMDKKGYCITVGYASSVLHNISDLKKINYYVQLNDELVLVDFPLSMKQKYLLINSPLKLLKNKGIIDKKITQETFLGSRSGYLCCYYNNEVQKNFYTRHEYIPRDKAIFIYEPDEDGALIYLDSTQFKESLNEKKR
jgi:hypothetical protein